MNRPIPLFLAALLGLVLAGLPYGHATPVVAQAGLPQVRYDARTGIIYVGTAYDRADPAQAPFAGYPSHPDAPKQAITVPQLAVALVDLGHPGLLVDQGASRWLLRSDLVVNQNARLEATNATISALRLDSTPSREPGLTRLIATGGHLLIQGIGVTSWNADLQGPDQDHLDGRSFLLAQLGARMDLIDAEVAFLGWADGEPSGLSWRKRATQDDPRTGATGSIIRSNIHHNYFGQYSYEAYGLQVFHSEFHHSIYYGFDPHDYSTNFEVAYNKVYNNGKHGIIFSRGCEDNWIHHNEVYGNAEHGIMLDRGTNNNRITDNLVYNNRDGIAIFQSSNNLIQNNTLRDNNRGVRINATYDSDDIFDGISVGNTVYGNTITGSAQYGIYLYERADNNIIVENSVSGSALSAIYIKTGGNEIARNTLQFNGHGITIIGGAYRPFPPGGPTPVPPAGTPGHNNTIQANLIENNSGNGIQVREAVNTLIGSRDPAANPGQGNQIRTNGAYGISLSNGSRQSQVGGNTIHTNDSDGVLVKGATSVENRISRNNISANSRRGITISDGANNGIAPPEITSAPEATTVVGTALPGATVEIYRDPNGQGQVFKGSVVANGAGAWSFALPAGDNPDEGHISALAISPRGDTSAFVTNGPVVIEGVYEVRSAQNGALTIYISGDGAVVTLPDVAEAVRVISPTVTLLENQGNGVWQANVSLLVHRGATLRLTGETVRWLKLRSQAGNITLNGAEQAAYNYSSFVSLRSQNGNILINGTRITSWDPQANTYDLDITNGRSYVLAKGDARMDIRNAELSYLGSADGESYGVSWRDTNDPLTPGVLRTRVTGNVIDSVFSYNYYGIYTYQAANMLFRGNKFHNNISYGFDPHDYSHHFVVEYNEAYENGNHGFIISRGCSNFVFRYNKSYNNRYTVDGANRNAHGFMLDPGSPNSSYPRVPSSENLLEHNQAWGNDGYGLRVLGSISNTIRLNTFRDNLLGVSIEGNSRSNLLEQNTISGNQLYGVYITGGSDNNRIVANTIDANKHHGVYLKTGNNQIHNNTITANGRVAASGPVGAGIALLPDTAATAASDLDLPDGARLAETNPELLSDLSLASALTGNQITNNDIRRNISHGIDLRGAEATTISANFIGGNTGHGVYMAPQLNQGVTRARIVRNFIWNNQGQGIRANGVATLRNSWRLNSITGNLGGGISVTSGANGGMLPPRIMAANAQSISGTALPGAVVEIFSDAGGQGRYYEGRTVARANGQFSLRLSRPLQAPNISATATDQQGNSSAFGRWLAASENDGSYRIYLPLVQQ